MFQQITEAFRFLNYEVSAPELLKTLAFFSEDRLSVRSMIEDLHWDKPQECQQRAIDLLADQLQPCEYIYLVFPDEYTVLSVDGQPCYCKMHTGKARWENAAKTIIKIGWPGVDHILIPLFQWLLDPNWPGSTLICDFLLTLPPDVLQGKIRQVMQQPERYEPYVFVELQEIFQELQEA